jgi:hypothetical protein
MIAPGFRTCGAGDPATRIAETYEIVTGAPSPAQRTDGVVLNGVNVPDPRNMLIAFDTAAAVVLDGSAPHQLFPADNANWLVPIGIVNYVSGAPGSFKQRTLPELQLNRIVRRYIGTVAESVLAADGVLRLRDRQTDQQIDQHGNIVSNDTLEAHASIQPSDIDSDPNNATRLIGNELVWVEGNLRVVGDARLFGGVLNFRAKDGTEPAGSFFLRRTTDVTQTTQNLEVSIGQPPSPAHPGVGPVNRLLVAASQPDGTLETPPALSVGTDKRVGIGVAVPATGLALDIKGDFGHDGDPTTLHLNGATVGGDASGNLLLTTGASADGTIELGADGVLTHVAIGTSKPQPDTALDVHGGGIAVNNQNAFLRLNQSQLSDHNDGILHIQSGGGTSGGSIVAFDGMNNKVGIGTDNPSKLLDVAGDAYVFGSLSLGGGALSQSRLFDNDDGILHIQSSGSTVTFDGLNNKVGIGTDNPSKLLDVAGDAYVFGSLSIGGGALSQSRLFDNNYGILHIQSGGNTVAFDGTNNVVRIGMVGLPLPGVMKLHVLGDAVVEGDLFAYNFPGPSDVRLKRDIQPLDGALEKLLALRGVEFEWARDDLARLRPGRQPGLIADEVERVFPNWVRADPVSNMKHVGPQGFEALVVEALRQLTKRIEALEAENSRLSQMLAARTG